MTETDESDQTTRYDQTTRCGDGPIACGSSSSFPPPRYVAHLSPQATHRNASGILAYGHRNPKKERDVMGDDCDRTHSAELDNQRVNHDESDMFKSKSEGQLLEDTKVVESILSSALRSSMRITTMVSPNNDDPLTSSKITFPDDDGVFEAISVDRRDRESATSAEGIHDEMKDLESCTPDVKCNQQIIDEIPEMDSRSKGVTVPADRGTRTGGRIEVGKQDTRYFEGELSENGQSSSELDNQGCNSQPSIDKSEGQLLEDVKVDGSMLSSASRSSKRISTLTSPNDDDPLVCLKAVELIRHQGSLRSSLVSKVNSEDHFEFKRPYFEPSHVDDGGGAELRILQFQDSNFCRTQSRVPQI
jgi:hypothetical protein